MKNLRLSIALLGALALAVPAAHADVDDSRASGGYCSATAQLLSSACAYEAADDLYVAKAKCINVGAARERHACLNDAKQEYADAGATCRAQLTARRALCGAIGEARYDPAFEPAQFDANFRQLSNPNPYFPLGIGQRWVYRGGDERTTVEVLDELYWITRHGIKMSGMPGWQAHLSDADIWALAAFVSGLPAWAPADFQAQMKRLDGAVCRSEPLATPGPPDARRGRELINQYACTACHTVPGVASTKPQVGPPLAGYATQQLIAGALANTPDNLARWLREPQRIDPLTAMPDLGVTDAHARDIAAYLGTLR